MVDTLDFVPAKHAGGHMEYIFECGLCAYCHQRIKDRSAQNVMNHIYSCVNRLENEQSKTLRN